MSNALGIAAVTRILQDLLNNALVDGDVSSNLGADVTVTALPPDRVLQANGEESTQLNLFLHQIRPNAAWRNVDLPTRNGRGELVKKPLLPLNLHYLLTAYAAEELHAEILLGYATQLFHESPVLSRSAVRAALAGTAVDGTILPPAFHALKASDLADQVELIKITPEILSTDDMSKLWTALQTHYRPTVAYTVSVVLIESREATRTALPVLSRGRPDPSTGREPGVEVQPSLVPPIPTLQAIEPPNQQIATRMGDTVTLTGHHLSGDNVKVRFTEPRSRGVVVLFPSSGTGTQVQVPIPPDPPPGTVPAESPQNPENWRAGIINVALVVENAGEPTRETNELPLLLAPRIDAIVPGASGDETSFTVTARPPVRDTQRISLIVGDRELPSRPLTTSPTATVSFQGGGFESGATHPVRLRVDGIDSILIDRTVQPPRFDPSQQVVIP